MNYLKKIATIILVLCMIFVTGCSNKNTTTKTNENNKQKEEQKKLESVDFILDWVPNTNHTGLYVALEKGFYKDNGVELNIKRPPEGSSTELVANGKANFTISFQDTISYKFDKDINLTAVAAIIDHNTTGIISKKSLNILNPKDLVGKRYGTWDNPVEQGILKYLLKKEGTDFDKVNLVPNTGVNSIISIVNNIFDSAWIYYAWDGVMAKYENLDTNFFYLKDFSSKLDYYTPIIVANNDFLKEKPELAKKVMTAIKKGYMYAMEHPEESADILIKHTPELKDKKDFVYASQKWISKQYAEKPEKWGYIDKQRWTSFYEFLYEQKLVETDIAKKDLFTNEFLED